MARTGRPRRFDREAALTSAMHLFWQHGYEGTSLEALRREMGGLSSASLYAAFGSKEALYREALAQYLETHGQVLRSLRDEAIPPRERIERALRASAKMQTDVSHPTGCMVTLSATICSDDSDVLREWVSTERASNRAAIRQCIQSAVDAGDLKAQANVGGLATLFDGMLYGISIQARDGLTAAELDAAISVAMLAWDIYSTDAKAPETLAAWCAPADY